MFHSTATVIQVHTLPAPAGLFSQNDRTRLPPLTVLNWMQGTDLNVTQRARGASSERHGIPLL